MQKTNLEKTNEMQEKIIGFGVMALFLPAAIGIAAWLWGVAGLAFHWARVQWGI